MRLLSIVVWLSVAGLAGCYTYQPTISTKGSKIDESLVVKIERGKSTRSDVLKWFGSPTRIITYEPKVTGMAASKEGESGQLVKSEIAVTANQEVYIWEYEVRTEVFFMVALNAYRSRTSKEAKDTLIVFINRETGVVEDFGFRRETNGPKKN